MHSALNYRHSRRSACDRCRGFKLRCERDHLNGMSCERCLKAQVVCTTSMSQPASRFLPSNHTPDSAQRGCPTGDIDNDQAPFSALHRGTNSKVSKTTFSSATPRRQERPICDGWTQPSLIPFLAMDDVPQPADNMTQGLPPQEMMFFPSQHWDDRGLPWSPDLYQPPQTDYSVPELPYATEENLSNSSAQFLDSQCGFGSQPTSTPHLPLQDQQFNNIGHKPPFLSDKTWDIPEATRGERTLTTAQDKDTMNRQDLRKSLLSLNMELMDDLDLLKADSVLLISSSLLEANPHLSTGNLDLPIFRMLTHSARFLELLQSLISPTDRQTGSISVHQSNKMACKLVPEEENTSLFADIDDTMLDDGAATTSSHDSGYQSATGLSPEDQGTGALSFNLDSTMSLSIVMTYIYLLRIYRAVFTRLYQLFLIIPPSDAAAFLMLPSLQFGQFQMEGNLAVQVQVLIELSSSMLGKVDRALGVSSTSSREQDGTDASPVGPIFEDRSFLAVRDLVLAQEQTPCEMSLKETMRCLRQVVKDPVSI